MNPDVLAQFAALLGNGQMGGGPPPAGMSGQMPNLPPELLQQLVAMLSARQQGGAPAGPMSQMPGGPQMMGGPRPPGM